MTLRNNAAILFSILQVDFIAKDGAVTASSSLPGLHFRRPVCSLATLSNCGQPLDRGGGAKRGLRAVSSPS